MQRSTKKSGKSGNNISDNPVTNAFIKTQVFAIIIEILIFIAVCTIALLLDTPSKYYIYVSLAAFSLAAMIVGYFSGMKIRSNGMIIGILFTLPLIALVIIISLVFNDFKADINIVYSIVSMLISSSLGGILAVNKRLK